MKIGIIGAGYIGRAVATLAARHGHDVMISNSRSPKSLFSIANTIGVKAGTAAEAASFGDIVLIAVPLFAYEDLPLAALEGKIVLDAGNYYAARDGEVAALDRNQTTTSGILAELLPESRVVKAFNAILAADIEPDARPNGAVDRRALPISGDDADAKKAVAAFIDDLGFDVLDAGALVEGWRFQAGMPGYCVRMNYDQLRQALVGAEAVKSPPAHS
ncbi:NADP oxidoreductase [Sphingobium sp. 22B]|nr:NADP oxidoreductase [Sphingobium sp. AM]KYC33778.1 NADP oxidoreductase [Sphingobium sp. 22B]OAP33516.1 NADP oxidoreductase [Sphingobium sp. 20006FA]